MTALAYTALLQDRIAYRLRGTAYSSMQAAEKAALDATWTTGALTGGYALDALTQIQQIGQYFGLVAPTSVPSEWEQWFVARTVLMASVQMRNDRYQEFSDEHERSEMAAIDAYSRNAITYDPGATPEASTLTVQNIRYYVTAMCAKKQRWETLEGGGRRVRPRLFVPPELVDTQIERVMRNIWQRGDWYFKRRKVVMTISALGAVTFDLAAGESFQSIASREFFYNDSVANGGMCLQWAKDGTVMSQLLAQTQASTGRPQAFRVERTSGTFTWTFWPTTDAEYTATGEVYIGSPTLGVLASSTTVLARFPVEFAHVIKDAVLAETLDHYGDPDGARLRIRMEDEITRLLPHYATIGNVQADQSVRDVYGDMRRVIRSSPSYAPLGGMGYGYDGTLGGGL